MNVNVGIVGAGFVSQYIHIQILNYIEKVNLKVLCDTDEKLLSRVKKNFNFEFSTTNYEELVNKYKCDMVCVILPKEVSYPIIKFFLKKKIPVFTEKPAAKNSKELESLFKLAKKNKVLFFIGYMKRFDPGVLYLKKILLQKKYGRLKNVIYNSHDGDSYCNPFEYFKKSKIVKYKKNGKSKYINSTSHAIDLLFYLLGDLKLVYKNIDVTTGEGLANFLTKEGSNVVLINSFSKSKKWIENIILQFENYHIKIFFPAPFLKNECAKIIIDNLLTGNVIKPYIKPSWSFKNQLDNLIKKIKNKKKLNLDYFNNIRIIDNLFK